MTATMLNLTDLEREILNHRLEVPDAIADGLGLQGYAEGEEPVGPICDMLLRGDVDGAIAANAELTKAILIDAVDGSTYAAAANGQETAQRIAAICRAGRKLAEKVSAFVGKPVRFPER